MTARFGRNKRRRAREAIASLEQSKQRLEVGMQMDRALLREQGETLRELQNEIARAKDIAGHYCVIFSTPKVLPHGGMPGDRIDFEDREPLKMMPFDYEQRNSRESFKRLPLDAFLTHCDIDQMRQMVHARVSFRTAQKSYAISEATLRRMPERELRDTVLREIAPALARGLIETMRR